MADHLGILVSSDRHLDYVVHMTRAAHAKGKQISLFFTGRGVLLTLAPQFGELVAKARLAVCDISFREYGLPDRMAEIPGVERVEFTTQARHAQILSESDRYLVF
ncbi:DsrE family protein [Desulfatitalea tepidiphila]|uniref:DsrE family protein n=1 Tax=Desulfatitalea tepidiphila TaxID=1185843 RepID=UPI0006B6403C|nr:DsrE family protein [Desulfatitalea tepidiphila]